MSLSRVHLHTFGVCALICSVACIGASGCSGSEDVVAPHAEKQGGGVEHTSAAGESYVAPTDAARSTRASSAAAPTPAVSSSDGGTTLEDEARAPATERQKQGALEVVNQLATAQALMVSLLLTPFASDAAPIETDARRTGPDAATRHARR